MPYHKKFGRAQEDLELQTILDNSDKQHIVVCLKNLDGDIWIKMCHLIKAGKLNEAEALPGIYSVRSETGIAALAEDMQWDTDTAVDYLWEKAVEERMKHYDERRSG